MTSRMCPQPLVMNRLTPLMCQWPSSSCSACLNGLEVAAGVRFGEDHRSGHAAVGESGQEGVLGFIVGESVNGFGDVLQSDYGHQCGIGPRHHLDECGVGGNGHVEAAVAPRQGEAHQVGLCEALDRFCDAARVFDLAVAVVGAFEVDLLGSRRHEIGADAAGERQCPAIVVECIIQVLGRVWARGGFAEIAFAQFHDLLERWMLEVRLDVGVIFEEVGHFILPPWEVSFYFCLYASISIGTTWKRSPTIP